MSTQTRTRCFGLLSDEASSVTGAILEVTGGR